MTLPSSLLPELPPLLTIAEECHFGRAAERLNVSQPRISQLVRRVEDIVGYQIFFRRPQIRLTPAGELLVKAARHALGELDIALARAEDAAAGRRGTVRLGYAPVSIMTRLPRILKSFHERYPLVQLQLHTTQSTNLWAGFEAGQYDLIISREARDRVGVRNHLFDRDSLIAVLPEGDPAALEAELPIAALAKRTFITSDEFIAPQWHRMIASLCRSSGFEPKITQRTNDWGSMLALVASGLGVAIVSSTLAKVRFPGVEFVALKEGAGLGSFWLASRTSVADSAVTLLLSALVSPDEDRLPELPE
jgi:DNA-binding transcriptional LysR family regulator